jgi:hypothetical protein
VYRELVRSTSGTDRAVSISVLTRRDRDSSRQAVSRSAILTSETVDRRGLLEKIEAEVERLELAVNGMEVRGVAEQTELETML